MFILIEMQNLLFVISITCSICSNTSENKLPLLWSLTLRLSTYENEHTSNYLLRISAAVNQLAQFKQSWSLFDAIKLQKQSNISAK